MDNVEKIKNANLIINDRIKNIVTKYKKLGKTAFDENGKLDKAIRSIFELEMRKCATIYLAEFPTFESKNVEELIVDVEERENKKNAPECRGGSFGIKLYPGIQPFIKNVLPNAGINALKKDGKVCATSVYSFLDTDKGLRPEIENGVLKYCAGINPPQHVGQRNVDSTRDHLDYFAEVIYEGKIDIDWILDVLPHEVMHNFIPGEGVFVEGTTERLTRECADKYSLRLTPTSHQRETQIISKLEKIIGREELSQLMSLSNKQKEERDDNSKKDNVDVARLNRMKVIIDEKMGIGTFDQLQNGFKIGYEKYLNREKKYVKSGKSDVGAYRNEYYCKEETLLQNWIDNNRDKCFEDDEWKYTIPDESKLKYVFSYIDSENELLSQIEKSLGIKEIYKQGKNGLEDCLGDNNLRTSNIQEATKVVREEVIGKTNLKDDIEQQI